MNHPAPAHPPTNKARSRRRRNLLVACAAPVLIVGASLATWNYLSHRPPLPDAPPIAIVRFAATPQFVSMPEDAKAPYLRAMRDNLPAVIAAAEREMTREQQIAALHNVIRARAHMELKEYLALPAGPARQAKLDRLIGEQELLRQRAAEYAKKGQQVGPSAVALKQFVESLAPGERIQMAQFFFDLTRRRIERNLPAWPFSPGG